MAKQSRRGCDYSASNSAASGPAVIDSAARGGRPCPGTAQGKAGLCFWHDPAASKTGQDIKKRLEAWAQQGHSMEGFALQGADLRDVDLNAGEFQDSVNLTHADLSKANLREAHLFPVVFVKKMARQLIICLKSENRCGGIYSPTPPIGGGAQRGNNSHIIASTHNWVQGAGSLLGVGGGVKTPATPCNIF